MSLSSCFRQFQIKKICLELTSTIKLVTINGNKILTTEN